MLIPIFYGGIRLLLLLIFLGKHETPQYWIDHFKGHDDILKEKLNKTHRLVYREEDVVPTTEMIIRIRNEAIAKNDHGVSLKEMWSPKYKKRFILGCLINIFQQLGGINILMFFSTQLFDDISGNGATITLIAAFSNVGGALLSLLFAHSKRIMTFNLSLSINAAAMCGVAVGILLDWGVLAAICLSLFVITFAIGNGATL